MAEKAYLLDTNVLVSLLQGKDAGRAIDGMYGFTTNRTSGIISVVTVGELRAFAELNGWGQKRKETLRVLLAEIVQLSIDRHDVLDSYARVDFFSQRKARPAKRMSKNDLWIAATALAAQLPLLTADKDFDHLVGLGIDVVQLDAKSGKPL